MNIDLFATGPDNITYILALSSGNLPLTKPKIFCLSGGTSVILMRVPFKSKTLNTTPSTSADVVGVARRGNRVHVRLGNVEMEGFATPGELEMYPPLFLFCRQSVNLYFCESVKFD